MRTVAAMALVIVMLGALMAALRLWQRYASPHPELVRKLLHMGMGLVTLSFPWLFDSAWPVTVLALLAIGGLLAVRRVARLRESVGGVLHSVARESKGELYFPLAVAAVFYLSKGVPVLYTVPVLLLTLADAMAALIGVRYGQVKFDTVDGARKSLEGAVAFFMTAFLCTHVTLLLTTQVGRVETLLIGLEIGFLVMLVELIAWRGLDNLFIPLFSFALLYNVEYLETQELVWRLCVLGTLSVFVAVWANRTTLDPSALIATLLIAYIFSTVGGLAWMLPGVACFATYALLWPHERLSGQQHDLRAVAGFSAMAMFWLFVGTRYPDFDWSYFGVIAFASQLATVGWAESDRPGQPQSRSMVFLRCALLAWVVPFIPWVLLRGVRVDTLLLAIAALPCVAVALLAFTFPWAKLRADPYTTERWIAQASASAVGTALAIAPWVLLDA